MVAVRTSVQCSSGAGDVDVEAADVMFLRDESDVLVDGDLDDQGDLTSFSPVSVDARKAYRLMEETVQFCNGHYQLPLPWRYHHLLPDNLKMAQKRLSGLQHRPAKDTDMLCKYVERMRSILDAGYAEGVPQDEIKTSGRA